MGNVEKWVVLGVLALIVGILVVSLNVDDPLKKDKVVLEGSKAPLTADAQKPSPVTNAIHGEAGPTTAPGGGATTPIGAATTPVGTATTPGVLDSVVDTAASSKAAPASAPIPAGSILKTTEGLQESFMTDAMFYTWKAGDTFPALAQRFYGDPSRLATLKRLNEGRSEVQPGERVLVPVFDLDAVQAPAVAATASKSSSGLAMNAAAPKSAGAETAAPPKTPTASNTPIASAGARTHVVKDGESLWKIAKQELGSGARWNEIYEANRDVLPSPEAVHTGQKLRVP